MWIESGSIDAAILAMTSNVKLPPWGSKSAVNRAGEALRSGNITNDQADVLESWRLAHRGVINKFQALLRARSKGKSVLVAQRLKRRSTIINKIVSRQKGMQLARMDDVAGCRLIFHSIEELREFRDNLHKAKFHHILKNAKDKYDYIDRPTERGYRGIHDVYECRSRDGEPADSDGLLIEIQYRTHIQHAWATAVEVVARVTANEHEPKFGRGDPRHIKLFRLASEMFARVHENSYACDRQLSDKELVEEFDKLDREIHVMRLLTALAIHKWMYDQTDADHVILQITQDKELELHQFDLELEASASLLELEKKFPEDDIVLVGADTLEEIESAFRNYFNNVEEFLSLYQKARRKLLGDENDNEESQ